MNSGKTPIRRHPAHMSRDPAGREEGISIASTGYKGKKTSRPCAERPGSEGKVGIASAPVPERTKRQVPRRCRRSYRMSRRVQKAGGGKRNFPPLACLPQQELQDGTPGQPGMRNHDPLRQGRGRRVKKKKIGIQRPGPEPALSPSGEQALDRLQESKKHPPSERCPAGKANVPVCGRTVSPGKGPEGPGHTPDPDTAVRRKYPCHPQKGGRSPREVASQADPEPHQRPEKSASFSIRPTASVRR